MKSDKINMGVVVCALLTEYCKVALTFLRVRKLFAKNPPYGDQINKDIKTGHHEVIFRHIHTAILKIEET